ncbi:hypothetical protein N9H45_07285 [Opitutales bacterium]|nr:hypothetical protein [Opitutales bacterium]
MASFKDEKPVKRKGIFGETFAHNVADVENPEDSFVFRWTIDGKWKLLLTYIGEVTEIGFSKGFIFWVYLVRAHSV